MDQGVKLAKRLNAKVSLIHVVDERIFLPLQTIAVRSVLEEYEEELRKEATQRLEKYAEKHSDSREFLNFKIMFGNPAKDIIDASEKFKADLIILGSHSHARFSNLFLGSTAERVAQRAPCPILILK